MTDQTAGLSESEISAQRAQIARDLLEARQLRPATVHAIAAAATVVVLCSRIWRTEGLPSNVIFTAAISLCIAAVIVLATRRLLVATVPP